MISNHTAKPSVEDGFMHNLREKTAPMHAKLEQSPLSSKLMSPDLTRAQYVAYLAAMREIISWQEVNLFPVLKETMQDLNSRKKLAAIEQDLAHLGIETTAPAIDFEIESPASIDSALGYMYVIEGSTLGGMVILKQLQGKEFISENTTHFFSGYGRNTGMMWKSFLSVLENHVANEGDQSIVISSAQRAFTAIDKYFNAAS